MPIRTEQSRDHEPVAALHREAFGGEHGGTVADLVNALRRDDPDGGFQVVRLSAHEPWMTGTFVYPNTFWDHDCVGLRSDRVHG